MGCSELAHFKPSEGGRYLFRGFRFYIKKRGNRQTWSPKLGSLGEAIFFGFFLLFGCVGLVVLCIKMLAPEWRANHAFIESSCKVLEKRINRKQGEDGPVYRPEIKITFSAGGEVTTWATYDVHKSYFSSPKKAHDICERFEIYSPQQDNRYSCWYDPEDPFTVVLARGYSWWAWALLAVPVSFIVIGLGGLVYSVLNWGKSAERRAALAHRLDEGRLFTANGRTAAAAPPEFLPDDVDLTNSPGTKLRYRLPMAASPGWTLFGLLAFGLVWNGIVIACVVSAVRRHFLGHPDWLHTLFIIPFAVVGIGVLVFFVRQLLITMGVGPTRLEISDHPLHPGENYRVFLSQSGHLSIEKLSVALLCEEEAIFREGTSVRRETQCVYRQEMFHREGFEIQRGLPFEAEFDLAIPLDVMHSFAARHNKINWLLVVEGKIPRWPDMKRSFPVIIHPAAAQSSI